MHRLFARQLAKARRDGGEVDLAHLGELVGTTYGKIVRDRKRTDHAIAEMTREVDAVQSRLRNAFDIVPEGLALFDASDRYVIWNHRYEEMHPALAGRLRVGMTFEEALRICLADGAYADAVGCEAAWLAARLERHSLPENIEEQHCADGRWLRVEEMRTHDGGSIGARIDITELKRREASFRLLFECNPVPMWIFDADTLAFLSVNDATVSHYGYSHDQFEGMTILDVRPEEDREATLRAVAETLERRSMDRLWKHLKADGTPIDVGIFAQPLTWEGHRAILVASIDVTDRKRAEDELARTREFLDAVIENVPTTIFVKEPREHRFMLLNRAGEMLFGRPREAVLGRRDGELFDEAASMMTQALEEELLHGDRDEIASQETIETPHGGSRILSVNRLTVRDESGAPRFLLGVAEDITEKRRAADRIAFLAHHDALTGLPNRAAFMDHLAGCIEEATDRACRFAVFSIDLDRFKSINDVFGHPVGDLLLQGVADRLRDSANGAFVARLGGDEFMMICRGDSQPAASEDLARRLRAAIAADFELDGHRVRTGLSMGVAVFPVDGRDATTLLANADAALYRSKAEGRDTIRFFEAEMDKLLRDRRALQSDLDRALERGEFSLCFQPQATMDGTVVGFEALLRWTHPIRGPVPPSTFIPLAEEGSLINDISDWVLREACRTAASWETPLTVAVNLSPVQFRHGDLPTNVHRVLLETGLPPSRLELEITEGVLINDFSRAVGLLRRLKAMGVKIAMDDFGTGYSSLSYLQAFPFDKIKIDRSFVSNLGRNEQSLAIVRAVIGLCRGLELPVIAEGVETEEQRVLLSDEHCSEIQGYLIGRPLPIEDYIDHVGPVRKQSRPQRDALRRGSAQG
jgi:diguanylate cyclase (GGDEF)-like protein/PAS domain S-box-containing protein